MSDPLITRFQRRLPGILPEYLRAQRWFGGKAHTIRSVSITEVVPIRTEVLSAYLVLVKLEYTLANAQTYALPLVPVSPVQAAAGELADSRLTLEREGEEPPYLLRDALDDRNFAEWLLENIHRADRFRGIDGEVVSAPGQALVSLWSRDDAPLDPSVMKGEQSNTSVRYGDRFILKFYRRIEEGVNLDQEIGGFLTDRAHFKFTPPLAGSVEYRRANRPPVTLAVLQGFVHNQGDAWQFTLAALDRFLERVSGLAAPADRGTDSKSLLDSAYLSLPSVAEEALGPYLNRVRLLGKRTGELHIALASDPRDPHFAAEDFSEDYRRSLTQEMASLAAGTFELLQERLEILPSTSRHKAHQLLSKKGEILSRLRGVRELRTTGLRARVHGDYHLGQVLVTPEDFAIIDFEGEPERPLSERRLKHSPLRDVAGMLRSFHYAASSVGIHKGLKSDPLSEGEREVVRWLRCWTDWASAAFLRAYLDRTAGAVFLPKEKKDLAALLEIFSAEKAIYELSYELKNRPSWVEIPLDGLLELV